MPVLAAQQCCTQVYAARGCLDNIAQLQSSLPAQLRRVSIVATDTATLQLCRQAPVDPKLGLWVSGLVASRVGVVALRDFALRCR